MDAFNICARSCCGFRKQPSVEEEKKIIRPKKPPQLEIDDNHGIEDIVCVDEEEIEEDNFDEDAPLPPLLRLASEANKNLVINELRKQSFIHSPAQIGESKRVESKDSENKDSENKDSENETFEERNASKMLHAAIWAGKVVHRTKRMQRLRDAFHVFDEDNTGRLSTRELHLALRSLGLDRTMVEVEELMRTADKNQNGSLDFDVRLRVVEASVVNFTINLYIF